MNPSVSLRSRARPTLSSASLPTSSFALARALALAHAGAPERRIDEQRVGHDAVAHLGLLPSNRLAATIS
jgi:hypothetical protein